MTAARSPSSPPWRPPSRRRPSPLVSSVLSDLSDGTLDIEAKLSAFGPRARAAFEGASTEQALRNARAEILGKKGELTAILRGLGQAPAELRRELGERVNGVRGEVEAAFEARLSA